MSDQWHYVRAGGLFGLLYIACALAAVLRGEAPGLWASAILGAMLVVLSAIDAIDYRLPDRLTLPLVAAGVLVNGAGDPTATGLALLAAAAGYGSLHAVAALYMHLRQRPGLGLGDAKLFAAGGAWLGLEALPLVLLVASVSALALIAAAAIAQRTITADTRIAFGPFLALGIWLVWLYGTALL